MRICRLLLFFLILAGCQPQSYQPGVPGTYQIMVPVYSQAPTTGSISNETVRSTSKAGKIYQYGNYIFQNDLYSGIHIIDNTQPASPRKIGFINIPFSSEIAVKGNYLYSNNGADLVVLDISDPLQAKEVNRIARAFPLPNQDYPPQQNVYFECVDKSKGTVVGWDVKEVSLLPNCRR